MKAPPELWIVAGALGDLLDEVVFVGGMIRALLITDPAAGPARPTLDVDCIVNAESRVDYHHFSERLRQLGFSECMDEEAPLCRWVVNDVRVDVMPIDPAILGFSNVWYPSGLEHAIRVQMTDGSVRIVNAVHFCATKIESFLGRGNGDFYHHDIEDLLAVVDGRPELPAEIAAAPDDVREFIAETFTEWLREQRFVSAIAGHLAGDDASQARRPMVLDRLRRIAAAAQAEPRRGLAPTPFEQPGPRRPALGPSTRGAAASPLPTRVVLSSSNLRAVSHDPASQILTVEFHRGSTYAYAGVPSNVYAGLLRAPSHGRYFHQWIRDRYRNTRLA